MRHIIHLSHLVYNFRAILCAREWHDFYTVNIHLPTVFRLITEPKTINSNLEMVHIWNVKRIILTVGS